jgi:hypothetical protein
MIDGLDSNVLDDALMAFLFSPFFWKGIVRLGDEGRGRVE